MSTVELVLWVKRDCAACAAATELMSSLSATMMFDWTVREGEYGDCVPVVATSDGRVLAEAPFGAAELVDAILAPGAPQSPVTPD